MASDEPQFPHHEGGQEGLKILCESEVPRYQHHENCRKNENFSYQNRAANGFFSGSCSVLKLHMKTHQIKLIKVTLIKSCILIVVIN